ncbi:hypothetical protein B0H14DRAFT_2557938 [Mycena olivaceomarginata]|nr:hypothetical protein B0H14DRAFT_2557938 [Mycena olivaceomarginata]
MKDPPSELSCNLLASVAANEQHLDDLEGLDQVPLERVKYTPRIRDKVLLTSLHASDAEAAVALRREGRVSKLVKRFEASTHSTAADGTNSLTSCAVGAGGRSPPVLAIATRVTSAIPATDALKSKQAVTVLRRAPVAATPVVVKDPPLHFACASSPAAEHRSMALVAKNGEAVEKPRGLEKDLHGRAKYSANGSHDTTLTSSSSKCSLAKPFVAAAIRFPAPAHVLEDIVVELGGLNTEETKKLYGEIDEQCVVAKGEEGCTLVPSEHASSDALAHTLRSASFISSVSSFSPSTSILFPSLVPSSVLDYMNFVLVSAILQTFTATHLDSSSVGDGSPRRLWEREGIGLSSSVDFRDSPWTFTRLQRRHGSSTSWTARLRASRDTHIPQAMNFLNQFLLILLTFDPSTPRTIILAPRKTIQLLSNFGLSNIGTLQNLLGFLECCRILERVGANQEESEDADQLDGITQPHFVAICRFLLSRTNKNSSEFDLKILWHGDARPHHLQQRAAAWTPPRASMAPVLAEMILTSTAQAHTALVKVLVPSGLDTITASRIAALSPQRRDAAPLSNLTPEGYLNGNAKARSLTGSSIASDYPRERITATTRQANDSLGRRIEAHSPTRRHAHRDPRLQCLHRTALEVVHFAFPVAVAVARRGPVSGPNELYLKASSPLRRNPGLSLPWQCDMKGSGRDAGKSEGFWRRKSLPSLPIPSSRINNGGLVSGYSFSGWVPKPPALTWPYLPATFVGGIGGRPQSGAEFGFGLVWVQGAQRPRDGVDLERERSADREDSERERSRDERDSQGPQSVGLERDWSLDGMDSQMDLEEEMKVTRRWNTVRKFSSQTSPAIPSLDTFAFLAAQEWGALYSLATSHMYLDHLILSIFYHKPACTSGHSAYSLLSSLDIRSSKESTARGHGISGPW